ncbi:MULTISPECIES: hypothetical protein [unclassified Paenibacillus]|uniref:hypothetical protein n=1 Tax=unclassified Paenibacillus TaxID=185978 RepID=UPI002405B4E9|nr:MULTISPECIES: hypothetical protein [unclassified Paenibacillus]MDF9845542.1 uncharacterized protein YydD (DUF2326 family) [Paenibacillus sp. PastF-2]MDF9852118.1 uncharacterized protein YydD (DUF2326 family) [Paenibacillus sp. PastM-2]MDF9858699.1 uncharacterized protein YydD (DUF2326 family) [Paenibacillus sp. PastF-1]MDH6483955.1 uncharacterized protein YydD (DUF2326 family) [Paenibacillus sp. PastH-2]MDH6511334.1 uncharacterized protein YydD (DUF2326 family) [Paenibacillus sp. PastM-3]
MRKLEEREEYLQMDPEELDRVTQELKDLESEQSRLYKELLEQLAIFKAGEVLYSKKDFDFFIENINDSISAVKRSNRDVKGQLEIIKDIQNRA